jgi:hypothetical protein
MHQNPKAVPPSSQSLESACRRGHSRAGLTSASQTSHQLTQNNSDDGAHQVWTRHRVQPHREKSTLSWDQFMSRVVARFVPSLGGRLLPVRSTSLRSSSVRTRAIRVNTVTTSTMSSGAPALVVWLHGLGDSGAGCAHRGSILTRLPVTQVDMRLRSGGAQRLSCVG